MPFMGSKKFIYVVKKKGVQPFLFKKNTLVYNNLHKKDIRFNSSNRRFIAPYQEHNNVDVFVTLCTDHRNN